MIISSGQSIPETTLRIGGADLIEAKRKARRSQSSQDELHVTPRITAGTGTPAALRAWPRFRPPPPAPSSAAPWSWSLPRAHRLPPLGGPQPAEAAAVSSSGDSPASGRPWGAGRKGLPAAVSVPGKGRPLLPQAEVCEGQGGN